MFQIRQLYRSDANEVNNIRKEAYGKAKGMTVKDSGIFWNKSDDQSTVLGIYNKTKLIATMRGEIVTSLGIVEKKMECPWTYDSFSFPAMILSRASINSKYEGKGFISILRLLFFKLAHKWEVKTILGTMTANSRRIKSMENMGYRFFENNLGWGWRDYGYVSQDKVLISVLDFEKLETYALKKLETKYKNFIDNEIDLDLDLDSVCYNEVKVVG